MPKKIDYKKELQLLKRAPDNALRAITVRPTVRTVRQLLELCARRNSDLSTTARLILEAEAPAYLASLMPNQKRNQERERERSGRSTTVAVTLPDEIMALCQKASAGLALDAPTLLRLIITEALPAWGARAGRAQQERRQASEGLSCRSSPARAVWAAYCRLALPDYLPLLNRATEMLDSGVVSLEILEHGDLSIILTPNVMFGGQSDHFDDDLEALKPLSEAGILVPAPPGEGSPRAWKVVAGALLAKPLPPPDGGRMPRRIEVD